jgi:hypothetical protein
MTVKELREYALLKRHELEEQADVCQWLDVMGILYFAVPNGGKRGKKAQAQAKSEGLKSGVPDLVILLPLGRAVFVEMKRRKGGTVTTAQKQWVADLSALGFAVKVCRGSDEAIAFISSMIVIK